MNNMKNIIKKLEKHKYWYETSPMDIIPFNKEILSTNYLNLYEKIFDSRLITCLSIFARSGYIKS
jgi:hypothetical protein